MKKSFLTLVLVIITISCNDSKQAINPTFSFLTSSRPSINNHSLDFLNIAAQQIAKETNQDSVLQFVAQNDSSTSKKPQFADADFFPITKSEYFKEVFKLENEGYAKSNYSDSLQKIDFDNYFVFILSHPSTLNTYNSYQNNQQTLFFDKVETTYKDGEALALYLECSRLGASPSGIDGLLQNWKNDVYILEKRKYKILKVNVKDEVFSFRL